MWTPYTQLIHDSNVAINSITKRQLRQGEVDWAEVKRYAKQISSLEKDKWRLQEYSFQCKMQMERTALFKEELVAKVFHPRNVERWLEQNIYDMMFGC
jgi:hypothetical protein